MNRVSGFVVPAPTVSIGLPVFNGENYLADAIDSILAQTFTDFELIIADNASTDETPAIIRYYADRDPRIRAVRHPRNIGAAKNYNYLVHCSSAPFFKWAAHDDLIAPEFLSQCLEGFATYGDETALVYPNFMVTDGDLNALDVISPYVHCLSPSPVQRVRDAVRGLGLVTSVFGLYRRDALIRTRLIGSHISSDFDLLVETALVGKIARLDGPVLFTRRLHDGISTRANATRKDLVNWFDPDARDTGGPFGTPFWRFLGSVVRVPGLTVGQRLGGCLAIAERMLRVRAGSIKRSLVPART
ncbi:glycosyltransferase family 2 protein [Tropicimonas sp. S265A]|uniref:glycosyltransferase family 2 protein n=1 Tax=Tropicimonas sp. S265A TaxID=3415134 RepID=UPI003C7C19C0